MNKNTAHEIYKKLRERVCAIAGNETREFIGEIEIDEAYFGPTRVRGKRGRDAGERFL